MSAKQYTVIINALVLLAISLVAAAYFAPESFPLSRVFYEDIAASPASSSSSSSKSHDRHRSHHDDETRHRGLRGCDETRSVFPLSLEIASRERFHLCYPESTTSALLWSAAQTFPGAALALLLAQSTFLGWYLVQTEPGGKPFLFGWAVKLELAALISWGMLGAAALAWWFGVHRALRARFEREEAGMRIELGTGYLFLVLAASLELAVVTGVLVMPVNDQDLEAEPGYWPDDHERDPDADAEVAAQQRRLQQKHKHEQKRGQDNRSYQHDSRHPQQQHHQRSADSHDSASSPQSSPTTPLLQQALRSAAGYVTGTKRGSAQGSSASVSNSRGRGGSGSPRQYEQHQQRPVNYGALENDGASLVARHGLGSDTAASQAVSKMEAGAGSGPRADGLGSASASVAAREIADPGASTPTPLW